MSDGKNNGSAKRSWISGIRIGITNNAMVVVAVIASVLLLYATYDSINGYNNLQQATERYISCQQDAVYFQEGSDYLTNECRYFAITGNPEHVRNFVEEVEVTRRRERGMDDIDAFLLEEESYSYLTQAMTYSNDLAEVEVYAMRLLADFYGIAPEELPQRVNDVALRPEDAALPDEEKRALGLDMLYGEAYQEQKAKIHECVEKSVNALIDDTRQQQIRSSENLRRLLRRQQLLIALLLVLLFVVVFLTYVLVIRPLERCVSRIRDHQMIPVTGSHEMQFLAQTYNYMFDQQEKNTEELTYSAMHDSLTGVYNRSAYDAMYADFTISEIGLLIIDIDKFKQFNDNYGHDVGDLVLQRVAKVIQESFRSEDYVFRIGGDEFCVIMVHANSQLSELVKGKIARAHQRLQNPTDGLPKITLSVGVAFGDRKNPVGDIFKDADTALYNGKRKGRGNCVIFGE